MSAYAPGFGPEYTKDGDAIRLSKFKGTDDERAQSFVQWWDLMGCGSGPEIAPKLRGLYEALDREGETLVAASPYFRSGYSKRLREIEANEREK